MSQVQTFFETLVVEHCCSCGIPFGMSKDLQARRLNDHKEFYCPNGHRQFYFGKSEAEQLKDELAESERMKKYYQQAKENLHAELLEQKHKTRAEKAAKTRILKRAHAGICPCCSRTFKDVQRHIASKHPEHTTPENKLHAKITAK